LFTTAADPGGIWTGAPPSSAMSKFTRRTLISATAALAALAPARSYAQIVGGMERGFLNGADFGLVPNSGAEGDDPAAYDQTANMQQAVNAAAGAGLPLVLTGGTYAINGVKLPYSTTIVGMRGATVLMSINAAPIFTGEGASALTLRDLILDGTSGGGSNADQPGLITLTQCEGLEFDSLRLQNGSANGLNLYLCAGRIQNCDFSGLGDNGIFVLDSNNLMITGNRISNCGNGGVRVWANDDNEHDGTLVANNDISDIRADGGGSGQNGNGINIYRANGVTVSGNHTRYCAFSAIRINSTHDTIVSGNSCFDSGEVAIFSEFAFSGSIIADNLIDHAAQGISITNFDQGGRLATCTGNIVRNITPSSEVNPDTRPAGIYAEADTVISNNVVESVPGIGIGVGWGPYLRDVAVTNNIIRDTDVAIGVSVAPDAGRAIVANNLITTARRAAIAGLAWTDMVTDDLMRDAAQYPAVTLNGNSVG
jgi:uncharacterized secreted repeat protein (TIGR03808 family)